VSAFEVATLFRNHDSLRVIVMNACDTAVSGDLDTMSGLAGALVQRGVPTVVAMQFPISDVAAISFAGQFYSSIADGLPVDAAVTEARRAIFFQPNYSEWATPVVVTRVGDCEVFKIVTTDN
jgi:CHAT domain-containing protein